MTNQNSILYSQVTSKYNKLLQVIAAISLLFLLLTLVSYSTEDSKQDIEEHFQQVADLFVEQAVNSSKVLLVKKDKAQLQQFLQSLTDSNAVTEAILYDPSGQVIAHSSNYSTIKELYGLEQGSVNSAPELIASMQEIRSEDLLGYIRLNIVKQHFTKQLKQQLFSKSELIRIMLIIAIILGFFLTRGFAHFSRHGVRLKRK